MLAINHLSVAYGQSTILNDVSMRVGDGQVVCLLGRNGVGKTTLLRAVMGVLRASAGAITFGDREITREPTHRRARGGIGYVPQGRGIFPYLTVRENLLMGLEARAGGRAEALGEVYQYFPVLATMERRVAGVLSGGQQQQLAIGRALVGQPRLLLLDEPTEGIQPSIVGEIQEVIARLRQERGMTILLVEQFLDFALGVANYYYVMEKGHIVAEGPTEHMQPAVVQQYLAV